MFRFSQYLTNHLLLIFTTVPFCMLPPLSAALSPKLLHRFDLFLPPSPVASSFYSRTIIGTKLPLSPSEADPTVRAFTDLGPSVGQHIDMQRGLQQFDQRHRLDDALRLTV